MMDMSTTEKGKLMTKLVFKNDKAQCDHCERVFDARGEACETINQFWICAHCSGSYSVEELAEYFELPVEHVLKELGLE